jgi:hypothetical protein
MTLKKGATFSTPFQNANGRGGPAAHSPPTLLVICLAMRSVVNPYKIETLANTQSYT